MDQFIPKIEEKIFTLLTDTSFYLLEVKVKPTNNYKIYLDGDNGISINDIAKINRTLRNQIDEENWFPEGDYSLEISSPGVDKPLQLPRQYNKHIGRDLEVTFLDETKNTIIGKLIEVSPNAINIEEVIGKKKETIQHIIPFSEIKTAIVQISFK
jgi:ribosome maturation factor RimP